MLLHYLEIMYLALTDSQNNGSDFSMMKTRINYRPCNLYLIKNQMLIEHKFKHCNSIFTKKPAKEVIKPSLVNSQDPPYSSSSIPWNDEK